MDSSDSNRANMPPASSWTLKGDGKLLEYMESIAKNLENRSSKTIRDMNNMMLSVDVAAVNLDNVGNKLQRLQQTQFIENRVQDEDVTMMEGHPRDTKQQSVELLSDVEATKIVMNDSLAMLGKCYEKISLEEDDDDDSDNEDDSLRHIYKPINSYDKRTPYIICTKEWLEKWHIGLKDDSDNEDHEPELINDDESEISEQTSREHVSTQEISSTVVKSDFEDDGSSTSGSPPTVNHIHVPNMSATLSDILNINRLLPELVTEVPPAPKVNPEPSFFRNQPTTTTTVPPHFNQQFFDNEPPELDNISVGNQSTRAPNLFTESDEENENFITTTPVKPLDSVNSNLFTDSTTVKTLDEPDRINVTIPKIPEIDKKIDNLSVDKNKSKSANTSKVSNLFESDTDDDEDYFDIIRKSNKKNSTPAGTMSVNLVKEDSPKMVHDTVEKKLSLPKDISPKTPENSKPLHPTKPETKHITKSEPKKVSNLFEDSDDDDDTFVSITPKSALKSKPVELRKEPSPVNLGLGDSKVQTKANETVKVKDMNVEKEAQKEHTLKDAEKPKLLPKESEVVIPKPVTTPKKLEKILFESSDDEDDFVIAAKMTPEPKLEKPGNLDLVAHEVSHAIPEDKPVDIPQDMPSPSDPSFTTVSFASEDTSSELFSPHSDVFFTPSDVTPNTTMTTATPVTPMYRSFIDELPPDDDFAGGFDTNEFDADQDDSDNFDQNNILTATDPFLLNEEPPELIDEAPVPEPKVVTDKREKSPVKSSPESFKNKFKMFETIHDSPKPSPEPEKEVKTARKKLNVNLNINVSALLPGAKRPSPKKVDDEPVLPDEVQGTPVKTVVPDEIQGTPVKTVIPEKVSEPPASTPQRQDSKEEKAENQPNLLVSLNKNRIKAPTTRKPSTRKARVQSYHESTQKQSEIGFDSSTEVKSVVPPLSVAEMLRTAKLKDQNLSRRSLNFDEVDEFDVPPRRMPVKPVQREKKPEPKVIEQKKSVETEPKRATKVTTTNDDPFMVGSDPPVSEIFKKVQIKDNPKPVQKPVVQEKTEKKSTKVPVFESDSDEDLFSPKVSKEPLPVLKSEQKKDVIKPEQKKKVVKPEQKQEVVKKEQKKEVVSTQKAPVLKLPKLFDDSEDDDDLFSSKAPKASAKVNKEVKSAVTKPVVSTTSTVSSNTKPIVNKPQNKNLSKSLFGSDDDDDDLFGGCPVKKRPEKKVSDVQKPVDSLFGEESDDDSLFGGGASKSKGPKSITVKPESSSKTATQTISGKKLTSAVNDPLADLLK